MAFTMAKDLFDQIDSSVITVLNDKADNFISLVTPLLGMGLGIYCLLISLNYLRGDASIEGSFIEWLQRIIGWGLIISFGLNINGYTDNIVPIIMGLPNDLSQAFSAGQLSDPATSIDNIMNNWLNMIGNMEDKMSMTAIGKDLEILIDIAILAICGFVFMAIAAAYIILAKVFLAVLVCLGPIFIGMALFPATRQYFSSWVSSVVNYMLIGVIYTIVAMLEIQILTDLMPNPDADGTYSLASVCYIALMSICFIIISLKIPEMSTSLASGGLTIGGFGEARRAAKQAGRDASSAIKGGRAATSYIKQRLQGGGGSVKPEADGV